MSVDHKTKVANGSIPRPQPLREGMLTVKGGDVFEAYVLALDPNARSKDYLLLAAKLVAKYAKATGFSDSQLRAVAWFAHLPEIEGSISDIVFEETNLLAGSFWGLWQHYPEAVLRLAKLIRARLKHAGSGQTQMTPHLTSYSNTKAARWKRSQREQQILKPPKYVEEFAAQLRKLNSSPTMDKSKRGFVLSRPFQIAASRRKVGRDERQENQKEKCGPVLAKSGYCRQTFQRQSSA